MSQGVRAARAELLIEVTHSGPQNGQLFSGQVVTSVGLRVSFESRPDVDLPVQEYRRSKESEVARTETVPRALRTAALACDSVRTGSGLL